MVRQFNDMARSYDSEQRVCLAQAIAQTIRLDLQVPTYTSAIEYRCKTGLVGLALQDLFSLITFIDPDPRMLSAVERKIIEDLVENADTLCLDVAEDEVSSVHADVIICAHGLGTQTAALTTLRALAGILNPNGTLYLVDDAEREGTSEQDLREVCGEASLQVVDTYKLPTTAPLTPARTEPLVVIVAQHTRD